MQKRTEKPAPCLRFPSSCNALYDNSHKHGRSAVLIEVRRMLLYTKLGIWECIIVTGERKFIASMLSRIYVFGGYTDLSPTQSSEKEETGGDVCIFDIETKRWSQLEVSEESGKPHCIAERIAIWGNYVSFSCCVSAWQSLESTAQPSGCSL